MIVPGSLQAALLGASGGHVSLSITTPLTGSNIPNNTTPQAISGVAASTAGNITTLQYKIDSGSWQNFSFTPALSVNYSGGNAGQLGAGTHSVTVQATDSASNTASVTSTYTITGTPPAPVYSLTPSDIYNGQNNHWLVQNATPHATVAYTQTQYDANSNPIGSLGMTSLGTTDANGNFSLTGTAAWASGAWSDSIQLYVGGVEVAQFTEYNFGTNPSYSFGPSVAPNGTTITLSIANSWASNTVTGKWTYLPSGTVSSVSYGSTSSTGNLTASSVMAWGSDTSASVVISFDGQGIATYNFTP